MIETPVRGSVRYTRNAENQGGAWPVRGVSGVHRATRVGARGKLFFLRAHVNQSLARIQETHPAHPAQTNTSKAFQCTGYPAHNPVHTMSKPLRQKMPTVAAWIDELREAFGHEMIDQAIRAGIEGQPTFYAAENGLEIGTPSHMSGIPLTDIQIGRMFPEQKKGR